MPEKRVFYSLFLLKSLALQTIQKLKNKRVYSLHSLHYSTNNNVKFRKIKGAKTYHGQNRQGFW